MSLERCPSCQRFISEDANPCPKCGHPLEEGWADVQRSENDVKSRKRQWYYAFAILGIVPLAIYATISKDLVVNSSEYGDQWGFTVPEVTVTCVLHNYGEAGIRPHVLVHAGGKAYGLNGAAMGSGLYPSAHEIMKKDKNGLYTFEAPTKLLERSLSICR